MDEETGRRGDGHGQMLARDRGGQMPGDEELVRAAEDVLSRSYAPYSGLRVGAAVITEVGNLYAGCNVENASHGLTMCAERTAVFAAVAAEGPRARIAALAVVCDQDVSCSPCGACRQVLAEFGPVARIAYRVGTDIRRTSVD